MADLPRISAVLLGSFVRAVLPPAGRHEHSIIPLPQRLVSAQMHRKSTFEQEATSVFFRTVGCEEAGP